MSGKEKMAIQDEYDSYEVIDPDDVKTEDAIRFCYATVRDNLLIRGLSRKEVIQLLEEYKLKERLAKMTVEELKGRLEINALMRELEKDLIVTNHCWINFHFDNLEYDDTYFAGDFYPDDNNGQYHCGFRYDRIKKTYEIYNNEVSEEEIIPLPIGYLEWKLEIEGKLDKTVWKISM